MEIEKEIVREVVRGEKHNQRKSANRKAQISVIHSAYCTDLCFAIFRFLRLCLSPRTTSRTISFLFPIVFSINLIPFFDICSVDLLVLAVFQPGCSGMCYFTWAAARSQQLLFVVLAAGLWCLTAGCHVKSPLFPQPPLKLKCAPRSRWEKAYMRKHTYEVRPSSFSQSNALRE